MKKTLLKTASFAVILTILFSSCASIVSKSSYPVHINTSPSDADVVITDKKGKDIFIGRTPAIVKLKSGSGFFSKASYQVRLSYPGYDDKLMTIDSRISGWYFGNLLFGGLIGLFIVDPATGAMWTIETDYINTALSPKDEVKNASNEEEGVMSLHILDINSLSEEQKEKLVKLN
ncbi:hypothetical protein D0T53_07680 [Dysgonomonas sp. 216]|uniref:hypothetical protein n=1 Tax=Dysgonomonas sp. 216 TaxID=2302934 RepID=UPI0013D1059C|nr:hypothetical protein [Dysgonomonas sp. 216]NDW18792.1 hypothetical protein [Dysgonomonas sp. 216]